MRIKRLLHALDEALDDFENPIALLFLGLIFFGVGLRGFRDGDIIGGIVGLSIVGLIVSAGVVWRYRDPIRPLSDVSTKDGQK